MPGDYTFDDGFRGARRLLALTRTAHRDLRLATTRSPPACWPRRKSDGINVPYDLSIAGFEDSPFSKQSWPALTTAKQATEDIARHAARRLIGDLQREANGEPVDSRNEGFSPELVVRGSTAPRPAAPGTRSTKRRRPTS